MSATGGTVGDCISVIERERWDDMSGAVIGGDFEALEPEAVVAHLDRYIIGQDRAKKAVAVALRNRWRMANLPPEMRGEVTPKNILMIGPTGVGKTEIARRVAQLIGAPFVKSEASRYTEIGYYGRDVESMVRDLVKAAVAQVQAEEAGRVRERARERAEERLLQAMLPSLEHAEDDAARKRRKRLLGKLRAGELDGQEVQTDVEVQPDAMTNVFSTLGGEEVAQEFKSALERMMPRRTRKQRMTVARARAVLEAEETERLVDRDSVAREAIRRAETQGVIFVDEIDKIISPEHTSGPDVSRGGVQRDLLPIVEGTNVSTRWGIVRTDGVLFIAAGAFSRSKPSDLVPELQGRFPIRVKLSSLGKDEFLRILTEPENALVKQYRALLATEGVDLEFQPEALDRIADVACRANGIAQDIGARRLHTVMEKLLEDVSFRAPRLRGQKVVIDWITVESKVEAILQDEEQTRSEL